MWHTCVLIESSILFVFLLMRICRFYSLNRKFASRKTNRIIYTFSLFFFFPLISFFLLPIIRYFFFPSYLFNDSFNFTNQRWINGSFFFWFLSLRSFCEPFSNGLSQAHFMLKKKKNLNYWFLALHIKWFGAHRTIRFHSVENINW